MHALAGVQHHAQMYTDLVSHTCAACTNRYPSDDINKFLWMVRIGGGVFPEIKERDYLGQGSYRVDSQAGKVLASYAWTDVVLDPHTWNSIGLPTAAST